MQLVDSFPEEAKKALTNSASAVISEIGHDVVTEVVHSVLIGENLRNSTELLTRKRLLTLNAASIRMMLEGSAKDPHFTSELHQNAKERLLQARVPKTEKWILEWVLGLTDKAFQNVLRDDTSNLTKYQEEFSEVIDKAADEFTKDYGELKGTITLGGVTTEIDWKMLSNLMTVIGSQTLAIRGSDKSTFGKLFEKLVLGSLLCILGFKQVTVGEVGKHVFWLSDRDKRESDATVLLGEGKGVRFDIGFIGRGNSEISLDKVSRFDREIQINGIKHFMATIIVVDRIGAASGISQQAEKIDGHIVQMSNPYWPKAVAEILHQRFGYEDDILHLEGTELQTVIKQRLERVDFAKLVEKGFAE